MKTNRKTVRKYLRARGIDIHEVVRKGPEHGNWKGGRYIQQNGGYVYIRCLHHPYKNSTGYVLEHHLVMEEHIGRYILPGEVVHHKDKNKQNNSLDNLELFSSNGEHLASELKGCVPKWTEDGIRRMREAGLKVA